MKLILCVDCNAILSLSQEWKKCDCGNSSGAYAPNGLHAHIRGNAVPLGFHNASFEHALSHRPRTGRGATFTAFVIPRQCSTVEEEA